MTYAYDLERVRVALADAVKAADALAVEWMDELRPRKKAGDEEK